MLGIVAASFSSADSALTSLTTIYCCDIAGRENDEQLRRVTHVVMCGVFVLFILIFKAVNSTSLIDAVYIIAGYTYGPLLGLFIYGLKDNATNKSAVSYYCEREAQRRLIIHDGLITVPEKLWKECDEYNRAHCVKKAFDLDCDDYEHGTPEGGCDGMGHYLCNECKWRSQESLRRIHEDESAKIGRASCRETV